MRWIFRAVGPDEVETEVTQRDQFRNDEVDLSDTVVREAIQNSLDAQSNSQQVRVTFSIVTDLSPQFMKHLFVEQIDHANAAGVIVNGEETSDCSALVIEDFGTKGLTGKVDERDNDNFSDFWRRHGKSHKSGKSGGRWGLGKLVYSYSSKVGAFFGVTLRRGDAGSYLMGQAVLNTHKYRGKIFAPHGFFALQVEEGLRAGLQIPFHQKEINKLFELHFALKRGMEPGLSVVIPYPRDEIDLQKMIRVGVENYFFPVLTEQLVLQFGDVLINRKSLRDVATTHITGHMDDSEKVFDFVEDAHELPEAQLHRLDADWYKDRKLADDDFNPNELEQLKEKFSKGELIGMRLPIVIKKKDGTDNLSFFDLYLRNEPTLRRGVDLYVRGGITVPGEAKFKHRKALGALVARDDAVSEFLGDAENAAHTKWNGRAEKLVGKYKYPAYTISAIRNSLVQFLDALLHAAEEEAEDALLDFFWTPKTGGKKPKKKRKSPGTPTIVVPPRPKAIVVQASKGGFSLLPGPAAAELPVPIICNVQMAYDTLTGNPFTSYSEYDFDVGNAKSLTIATRGCTATKAEQNKIELEINSPEFEFTVTGFDDERDVITRISVPEVQ